MALDKTTKRKRKTGSDGGSSSREEAPQLWQRTEARKERRYEPKTSPAGILTLIGAGLGAILAGAGTYAQWFRAEELGPHKLAPYLLAAGAALMIAVALFGHLTAKPIRVGDAGVAVEKDQGEIDRIPWHRVTRLALTPTALTVHASGTFISIPLRSQPQAAARAIAEAKTRIPERAADLKTSGAPPLDESAGELVTLEAPQAAGQRCKASDKIIAFEKDARFCGRCGEIYHKDTVPKRCLTCSAALKAGA